MAKQKKPKVFVTRQIPEEGIKLLQKKYDVTVSKKDRVLSKKEIISGVRGKDALLCLLTDKIDGKIMNASKKLKVIANYAVGYNNIDVKAATKRKIPVTNTPGVLTDTVADHAFTLLMAAAHRISESDRFTKAGKYKGWEPMLLLGRDVTGKTLGVIGGGRIGSAVAERAAKGFGMKVLYYDVKRNPLFEKASKGKLTSISNILRKADFVTVHVPLLPSTHHLIGKKELRMMKKTAILINTSRGPVVDDNALVDALKKGVISGAALDVYEKEPKLAAGLAKQNNVTLTPHTASGSIETRTKMSVMAARNVIAALDGRKPANIVNPEVYS